MNRKKFHACCGSKRDQPMEFFVPFLNTTYNPKNAPKIFSSEIHPKSTRALLVGGFLPPI